MRLVAQHGSAVHDMFTNAQEDKMFLRTLFDERDAKQGEGQGGWRDQPSIKEILYTDLLDTRDEIHAVPAAARQTKKLNRGTRKSVNAMLDQHGHHAFMRQDSVKGRRDGLPRSVSPVATRAAASTETWYRTRSSH